MFRLCIWVRGHQQLGKPFEQRPVHSVCLRYQPHLGVYEQDPGAGGLAGVCELCHLPAGHPGHGHRRHVCGRQYPWAPAGAGPVPGPLGLWGEAFLQCAGHCFQLRAFQADHFPQKEISQNNIDAKLVLQIHDELLIEVNKKDKEEMKNILKNCMENVIKLSVPLKADVNEGNNWYEAK